MIKQVCSGAHLTTDVFVDLLTAAVTAYRTAPVKPTAAFLYDRPASRAVTAPAAHHLTPVCAVSGTVALAPGSAWRPRTLVGVAEVRRRFDVDELRRTGTTAGGDRRLNSRSVKQQKPRRAFETCPRAAAVTYQRHLPYDTDTQVRPWLHVK